MSKINQPIPPQTFEIITVDILNILLTEFAAQSDDLLKSVKFYFERISPIDKVNIPAVVVRYVGSRNRVSGRLEQNLTNIYAIDCYTSSKVTDSSDSDITSSKDLQRIMGAIRWILMFSGYFRLDFAAPIIESTVITSIEVSDQRDVRDTETTMWGRVTFEVNAVEGSEEVATGVLESYQTLVTLFETDKGYEWLSEKTS
ncbi:MAG: hypothetical protein S4CHLAM20_04140 [Chlamydiia bacterium]|nr:hypothetical protein [Chlamydiia bacterium]